MRCASVKAPSAISPESFQARCPPSWLNWCGEDHLLAELRGSAQRRTSEEARVGETLGFVHVRQLRRRESRESKHGSIDPCELPILRSRRSAAADGGPGTDAEMGTCLCSVCSLRSARPDFPGTGSSPGGFDPVGSAAMEQQIAVPGCVNLPRSLRKTAERRRQSTRAMPVIVTTRPALKRRSESSPWFHCGSCSGECVPRPRAESCGRSYRRNPVL